MKRYILACLSLMLLLTAKVDAQDSYTERVKKYIAQYSTLALMEQKNCGIPASITLGQGILETEAGASELMTEANNHFGIKCSNNWLGPTFSHTDDAPDECFKKYSCAAESFRDHSQHLIKNPRYSPLFRLSTTDYASWAVCLKKCGYATNPQYAQRLIKIIEDFKLQEYTYAAMDSSISGGYTGMSAVAAAKPDTVLEMEENKSAATPPLTAQAEVIDAPESETSDSSKVVIVNGMKAFYAHKGEMLLSYAVTYNIRYPRLLETNDLKDAPLPFDMPVYLEKKLTSGIRETHTVANGETMLMIAQSEGMQLKKLMSLNLLYPNEEPATGSIIQLQKQTTKRPEIRTKEIAAHKTNAIITTTTPEPKQNADYVAIDRTKPAAVATRPAPAAPVKPAAVVVETKNEPFTATAAFNNVPKKQPAAVAPKHAEKVKEPEIKQDQSSDEELARLKADLDKVVYADDSKLPVAKAPVPAKKELTPEPVKPAAKTAVKPAAKYYTIRKGETAFSIAKRNNITVDQLYKLNDIDAADIKVGKKIIVQE